ncbi:MAG TPA: class I SAM-dependent methyltransferase [Syntrophales bacterium]|jgi:ABC-2 type transport system ATP-binding protein|nr:class I SAM-dependent methyltransferase [Syntrophales bacterium]HON23693.1 class I SAM-dependent methyltransferase [Syntrophales bacterium]HOU78318.1 class I SAM-dependent methyltransferase [Syntrophales bacterium]HPC31524.1 class I SAM-dependent methyltransferase [Syntrophales bacterium]HQG34741.1 class I SAM-dependent methyltransferase [Syntrophales bacterium]
MPVSRQIHNYWGRYATTYDRDTDYVVGRSLRRSLFRRLSREGDLGVLLECGCGTGYFTRAVAGRAVRIVALDLSGEMIAAARARLQGMPTISFLQADCGRPIFTPTSFDTVLMVNILNTLSPSRPALRQTHRVLKYGGVLIAAAYTDYDLDALDKLEIGKRYFERFGLPPPGGLNNYTPRQMASLIEKAGFRIESLEVLGEKVKAVYVRAVKSYVTVDGAVTDPARCAPVINVSRREAIVTGRNDR